MLSRRKLNLQSSFTEKNEYYKWYYSARLLNGGLILPCTPTTKYSVILLKICKYLRYLSVQYFILCDQCHYSSVSGLSGSVNTAQSQVSVGMGLLAGSTVMLLTVIWGTCVIVGKCDIENSVAIDEQDTKGFSLSGLSLPSVKTLFITYT